MAKLNQVQLDTLKKHKHLYDLFIKSGVVVNFNMDIQNELLEIYRTIDPVYTYNNRCGACVGAFLVNVYKTFADQIAD